jgi:hypothetical protein
MGWVRSACSARKQQQQKLLLLRRLSPPLGDPSPPLLPLLLHFREASRLTGLPLGRPLHAALTDPALMEGGGAGPGPGAAALDRLRRIKHAARVVATGFSQTMRRMLPPALQAELGAGEMALAG